MEEGNDEAEVEVESLHGTVVDEGKDEVEEKAEEKAEKKEVRIVPVPLDRRHAAWYPPALHERCVTELRW